MSICCGKSEKTIIYFSCLAFGPFHKIVFGGETESVFGTNLSPFILRQFRSGANDKDHPKNDFKKVFQTLSQDKKSKQQW
jgi:hypothetical protein